MILLCGIPSEPPLKLVLDAAEALSIDYVLFNQRESHHSELSLRCGEGSHEGLLRIRETEYRLDELSGVFIRLMDHRELPENKPQSGVQPKAEAVLRSDLLHTSLVEWLEIADCRVMNRASAMATNQSKPFQAQLIQSAGFKTPETLITNDPEKVRAFKRTLGRVVYKSISAIRSIVKELSGPALDALEKIRGLPTQFQSFVPGTNIRVHTTGDKVFATEIRSEATDYRYASSDGHSIEMVPCELPAPIQARCLELSKRLDLPLSGIDLKRTPDDDWYCFEVNPCPAYSYYQSSTGQPIAEGIVRWLAGPDPQG